MSGRLTIAIGMCVTIGAIGCDGDDAYGHGGASAPSVGTTEQAPGVDPSGGAAGAVGANGVTSTENTPGATEAPDDSSNPNGTNPANGTNPNGEASTSCESSSYAAGSCACAEQALPTPECDPAARTCSGDPVPPDREACEMCVDVAAQMAMDVDQVVTCACSHCAVQLAACYDSADQEVGGDPIRDQQCQAVVECVQSTDCGDGVSCFCGQGVSELNCGLFGAQGACRNEIAAAAGCANESDNIAMAVCVQEATDSGNPDLAITRASSLGECIMGEGTGAQGHCGHLI